MLLEQVLGSIHSLPDLPRLVAALGHQPMYEPLPNEAWNKAHQRLLEVTAVGSADGLPWFAISSRVHHEDCARLARRVARRGSAAIVLALDESMRRLAIAAAFDRLALVDLDLTRPDPEAVDSLARLAGSSGGGPMAFAARAADALSTEPVSQRFFRQFRSTLEHMAGELPCPLPANERHRFALLQLTRILFLYFVQTKGWLGGRERFLAEEVDRCLARGRRIHRDLLRPLFFGTLNRPRPERSRLALQFGAIPFLNGGLFEPHPLERRCGADVPNVLWCAAFDQLFERFHFTVSERDGIGQVGPDMLGRVFEGVMAPDARRSSGTFYTPSALVRRVVDAALVALLADRLACPDAEAERRLNDPDTAVRNALSSITVLDPAAGSGAFLLYTLERLSRMKSGDRGIAARKRLVLHHNLFGVDQNATAVRLAELRLWLAVIADEPAEHPERVSPLPNLDCLIRQGDSLFNPGGLELGSAFASGDPHTAALARLRREVVQASGCRKRDLERRLRNQETLLFGRLLDSAESRHQGNIDECLREARAPDLFGRTRGLDAELGARLNQLRENLRRLRRARNRLRHEGEVPWFHYQTHFADVFARGGFDLVVGNPPWLRSEAIPGDLRKRLASRYSWWRSTSGTYGNSPDLAIAFVERALELAAPHGTVALLIPAKLSTASYGAAARHALASTTRLHAVVDLTRSAGADFDATVYPLALIAGKRAPDLSDRVRTSFETAGSVTVRQTELRGGGPWVLRNEGARRIAVRLAATHPVLGETVVCHLGLKTGLNRVFLNPSADLDPEMVRWAIRGRDLRPFFFSRKVRLLWTHTAAGNPASALPPGVMTHLAPFERSLRSRKDYRSGPWWMMFRVGPAVATHRVIWADLSRQLMAAALTAESDRDCIPLNSCYVAPAATAVRADAIAAWLNSTWIRALARLGAVPASGGFVRFNARVVSQLPLAVSALDDGALAAHARAGRLGEEVQSSLDALVAQHLDLSSALQRTLRASLDQTTSDRR